MIARSGRVSHYNDHQFKEALLTIKKYMTIRKAVEKFRVNTIACKEKSVFLILVVARNDEIMMMKGLLMEYLKTMPERKRKRNSIDSEYIDLKELDDDVDEILTSTIVAECDRYIR